MTYIKQFAATLFLSGLIVFSSCKKDDEPVDPRNALIGTYDIELGCASGKAELEIAKDPSDPKKLILTSEVFEVLGLDEIEAEVKGGGFELEDTEYSFIDPEDGVRVEGEVSGEGEVKGKNLEMSFTLTGAAGSQSCDIEGEKQ